MLAERRKWHSENLSSSAYSFLYFWPSHNNHSASKGQIILWKSRHGGGGECGQWNVKNTNENWRKLFFFLRPLFGLPRAQHLFIYLFVHLRPRARVFLIRPLLSSRFQWRWACIHIPRKYRRPPSSRFVLLLPKSFIWPVHTFPSHKIDWLQFVDPSPLLPPSHPLLPHLLFYQWSMLCLV